MRGSALFPGITLCTIFAASPNIDVSFGLVSCGSGGGIRDETFSSSLFSAVTAAADAAAAAAAGAAGAGATVGAAAADKNPSIVFLAGLYCFPSKC